MKSTRMLILVALALASSAIIGVTSASATALCKENTTVCSPAQRYPSGTSVKGSLKPGTNFELAGSLTVQCSSSTLTGKTTAETGDPLPVEITAISLSGCTGGCKSAEAHHLPYNAGVEAGSGGDGTTEFESGGSGNPGVNMSSCLGLGATCNYSAAALNWTFTGGTQAIIQAKRAPLTIDEGSSPFCPHAAELNATYEITSPSPAFAVAGGTVLCKSNVSLCSGGSILPAGTVISAEAAKPIFEWTYPLECGSSAMSAKTTAESGRPLGVEVTAMTVKSCSGCSTVEAHPPYAFWLESTSAGNGEMTGPISLTLKGCAGINLTCQYAAEHAKFNVEGGGSSNARIRMQKQTLTIQTGSGGLCPSVLTYSVEYSVSTPTALWVTREA